MNNKRMKFKEVMEKYPKGFALPDWVNSGFLEIIKSKLPKLARRLDFCEKEIRKRRVYGETHVVCKYTDPKHLKRFQEFSVQNGLSDDLSMLIYDTFIKPLMLRPKVEIESKSGVFQKTYMIQTLEEEDGEIFAITKWSNLSPNIQFRNDKKQTKEESDEVQAD